jgi:hypothetical protein
VEHMSGWNKWEVEQMTVEQMEVEQMGGGTSVVAPWRTPSLNGLQTGFWVGDICN